MSMGRVPKIVFSPAVTDPESPGSSASHDSSRATVSSSAPSSPALVVPTHHSRCGTRHERRGSDLNTVDEGRDISSKSRTNCPTGHDTSIKILLTVRNTWNQDALGATTKISEDTLPPTKIRLTCLIPSIRSPRTRTKIVKDLSTLSERLMRDVEPWSIDLLDSTIRGKQRDWRVFEPTALQKFQEKIDTFNQRHGKSVNILPLERSVEDDVVRHWLREGLSVVHLESSCRKNGEGWRGDISEIKVFEGGTCTTLSVSELD